MEFTWSFLNETSTGVKETKFNGVFLNKMFATMSSILGYHAFLVYLVYLVPIGRFA